MNLLMQLRKVVNHPDLFEVRPIVTSFAMQRSAVADYEIKELLVRRRLLAERDEDREQRLREHLVHVVHEQALQRARALGEDRQTFRTIAAQPDEQGRGSSHVRGFPSLGLEVPIDRVSGGALPDRL